jgi:class 3 adenylate cyclase
MRAPVPELPSGTVTLLFSDIGRSTELVKHLGERYGAVLAEHRDLVRRAVAEHRGVEVDTQGDGFFFAFERASDAVAAAAAVQRGLAAASWQDDVEVQVRMGLHTCEPHLSGDGYVGVGVHRAARICTTAHAGQVLLSRATAGVFDDDPTPGVTLRDLGDHPLKDFDRPERIYQLVVEGLRAAFPPPRPYDKQGPLSGTIVLVLAEGRRMMRLVQTLEPEVFGALISEYQFVIAQTMERAGSRQVDVAGDSVAAAFPTAKDAAGAALAAQRTMASHEWPHGLRPSISVGVHAGQAGVGWVGPAILRCGELCEAAEGGQIFLSQAVAALLEDENLDDALVRDLGEVTTRRTGIRIRAHELVPSGDARARLDS